MKYFGYILRLILSSKSGWEDLSETDTTREEWMRMGFYPLLAMVALSCFVKESYEVAEFRIAEALQDVVICLVALMATLFIADELICMVAARLGAKDKEKTSERIRTMDVFLVGMLGLIELAEHLVPVKDTPIFVILPVFLILVISTSGDYVAVPKGKRVVYSLATFAALLVPYEVIKNGFQALITA